MIEVVVTDRFHCTTVTTRDFVSVFTFLRITLVAHMQVYLLKYLYMDERMIEAGAERVWNLSFVSASIFQVFDKTNTF